MRTLENRQIRRAVIVGAGYIGLEMAEALIDTRPLGDPGRAAPRGAPHRRPRARRARPRRARPPRRQRPVQHARRRDRQDARRIARPRSRSRDRGPTSGRSSPGRRRARRRSACDPTANSPPRPAPSSASEGRDRRRPPDADQPARRVRRRRLRHHPPPTPRRPPTCRSGTTAHKQGRIAGENALGGTREFAGSLGTQVVKVFDLVAARTGLRDHEATAAGFDPVTVASEADDHKAYYPGSHPIAMRYTGDRRTGQLLGLQLVGHLGSEIAKRIDIAATAIFNQMTVDGDLRPRPLLHAAARLTLGRAPRRRAELAAPRRHAGRRRAHRSARCAGAAIGCVAMMFGAGALGRLVSRTPLVRAVWSRRRPSPLIPQVMAAATNPSSDRDRSGRGPSGGRTADAARRTAMTSVPGGQQQHRTGAALL